MDKNLKPKHVKALDAGSDSDGSARKKRRDRSRSLSRSRSRSRSRSPKRGRKKLREGDKVQAHFRGKSSAKLYPGKVVKIHSDGTVDVKRVTAWKSRLAYAIDAFPGLPHSVDDVRTGMRTATATRGSRRST